MPKRRHYSELTVKERQTLRDTLSSHDPERGRDSRLVPVPAGLQRRGEVRLTIFSVPRHWQNEMRLIQENAVRSWQELTDDIILLGDEDGTAPMARRLGVRHVPKLRRNAQGTPLVPAIFAQGMAHAHYDVVAYVNADVLLFCCLLRAVRRVYERFPSQHFLMVGGRWNAIIDQALDFSDAELAATLRARAEAYTPAGMDYFVFRKGLYPTIPPFAVGRTAWDNWLAGSAACRGIPVIDATLDATVIHQFHGNDPPLPRQGELYNGVGEKIGPEVNANRELFRASLGDILFWREDCPFALENGKIVERPWAAGNSHRP